MKIAIASGKGGTGKTTLSLNFAAIMAERGKKVCYADCDVEEPNGHLFLNPSIDFTGVVGIPTPVVDNDLCDGCGECGKICHFSAIIVINGKALTFPEMCHGCGGCALVCTPKAIREVPREIGVVETGKAGDIDYIAGRLRIGEATAVPIIREVKRRLTEDGFSIIDASPGTSCPVMEAVKGADYVVLVTEPTPFGLNDLKLAVEMIREIGLPHGVVLNRAGFNNELIYDYCRRESVDFIAEIPDDRRIAEACSRGEMLVDALPEYRDTFGEIMDIIEQSVKQPESL